MLTVTAFAAAAIQHLLERARAADDAGLRIARDDSAHLVRVRLARKPASDDEVVVTASGTRVFLDAPTAKLLHDKVLDVSIGPGGRVEFVATAAAHPSGRRP